MYDTLSKQLRIAAAAVAIAPVCAGVASGQATTQFIDFVVPIATWEDNPDTAGGEVEVESFSTTTRTLAAFDGTEIGGLNATFSGLSQASDTMVERNRDFVLTSFSNRTRVANPSAFNRTVVENGALKPNPANTNPYAASAIEYKFDLSSLDSYLSNNGLTLDALDAKLDMTYAASSATGGRAYDVLLSYDSASEGLTRTDIDLTVDAQSSGAMTNAYKLWVPTKLGEVGDLVGDDLRTTFADFNNDGNVDAADYTLWRDTLGATINDTLTARGDGADADFSGSILQTDYDAWAGSYGATDPEAFVEDFSHKIIRKDVGASDFPSADELTTIDLLALYNEGVREFNVVVTIAAFSPSGRPIFFNEPGVTNGGTGFGSGVFFTTSGGNPAAAVAPEPGSGVLFASAMAILVARRARARGR